ncbi:MAG TPA: hypothetical protein DDW52_18195 [Planctomycetaceae bacterium]|nr:hypothetical protein [Planctomycetaceae bacterium]
MTGQADNPNRKRAISGARKEIAGAARAEKRKAAAKKAGGKKSTAGTKPTGGKKAPTRPTANRNVSRRS